MSVEDFRTGVSGSGVCPVCGLAVADHGAAERKTCHDAASGYQRGADLSRDDWAAFVRWLMAGEPATATVERAP